MYGTLVEDVQRAYEADPTIRKLIEPSTIEVLGLTRPEVITLCALLLAGGDARAAAETIQGAGVKEQAMKAAAHSLAERGLITRTEDPARWTFEGVEAAMRVQTDEEAEDPEHSEVQPSPKLVLRPMRERVIFEVRQGQTPAAGLGRVYTLLYGPPKSKDYPLLGMMAKELGRDRAALFLLEHCHQQFRNPLAELIGLARAQAAGFRPADAPEVDEQRAYFASIARQAREKKNH